MIDIADAGLRWADGRVWIVAGDPALVSGGYGRLGAEKRVGELRRALRPSGSLQGTLRTGLPE
jgi:hypothetical protein